MPLHSKDSLWKLGEAFKKLNEQTTLTVEAIKMLGDELDCGPVQQPLLGPMKPDATTWVMKDQQGQKVRVKVKEMTDAHLWRWIRYFRRKWRDSGFTGNDALLDATIKNSMVTAPAIYAEAVARGVIAMADPPPHIKEARNSERLETFVAEIKKTNSTVHAYIQSVAFEGVNEAVVVTANEKSQALTFLNGHTMWLTRLASAVWGRKLHVLIALPVSGSTKTVAVSDAKTVTMSDNVPGERRITLDED